MKPRLYSLALLLLAAGCGSPDAGLDDDPSPECTRRRLEPVSSHRVEPGSEQLICYGLYESPTQKRHVIEFQPKVDQASVLHHMTLLQAPTPANPVPAPCDAEAMTSWRSVYGWSPGGSGFELPPEAGFVEEPGVHYVVQLHYLNSGTEPVDDASGFELCATETLRDNDADIMAFGGHEFIIEPNAETHATCSVDVPANGATTHLFAAFPHMHRLGASIETTAHPADGSPAVDLGSIAEWDFDAQRWLPISHVLRPGDRVETRCNWKSSLSYAVGFGPSTEDEMCYSFTMYYPRIEDPNWHWALPALYAKCTK